MSPHATPKAILIEDDPEFRYLIQRYAGTSGWELVLAGAAGTLVGQIRRERPDAILLDVTPSLTDGARILQELKTDPIACRIPLFVCVASQIDVDRYAGQADGCLLKPVMYEDFVGALSEVRPDCVSGQVKGEIT